jgi:hypothetical protein
VGRWAGKQVGRWAGGQVAGGQVRTGLGRWPSLEAAKAKRPPMKPLPRREPNRERKIRRENGAERGREEREEAKVSTSTWSRGRRWMK